MSHRACLSITALFFLGAQQCRPEGANRDWPVYGGSPEGTRYSPLKQINRSNVGQLEVAWTYEPPGGEARGGLQTHPIIVHGVVYANTPAGHV